MLVARAGQGGLMAKARYRFTASGEFWFCTQDGWLLRWRAPRIDPMKPIIPQDGDALTSNLRIGIS